MPTNIIAGSSGPAVSGNAWQSVGAGAQGLAALLGSAFAARNADQAAKKAAEAGQPVPIPGAVDPNANLGPTANPAPMDPGVLGNPSADLARLTASAPLPGANPFGGANDMGFKLGRDEYGGMNSLFTQRFPGLFPQASRSLTQYGGL